jgi:hypothetical protein
MMQAKVLCLTALGAAFVMAACSDAPSETKPRNVGGGASSSSGGTPGSSGTPGSTGPACPTGIAAPVQLATDATASDVRIVGASIFFRVGDKVVKVGQNGSGRADVYTSPDLVSVFTDGTTLVNVESPNPPDAVLRIGAAGSDPGGFTEVGTNLNAASTLVFGADAKSFYLVADADNGDVLYKVDKENPGGIDTVAETGGVVTDPQVVGSTLWYVKDQTQIYKLVLDGASEPALVATVDGGCSLAVGATHLYCATGGVLEQRDLAGANAQKLFDETTSKLPSAFGASVTSGDTVVSRSASGEGALKNVVRSVAAGTEGVVACGRDAIGSMSTDGTSAAWIETGKGVFLAPLH